MGRTVRVIAIVILTAGACSPAPAKPRAERAKPTAGRELGSWKGEGNTTLGFVSESGSFRITWSAQNKDNAHPGAFLLTLRSGISGRVLKVVADHHSAGGGSVEFGDDPRMYEFVVESSGIAWAISVQETWATR
jgi:outer membrane biogenesis lipoprotein LolB